MKDKDFDKNFVDTYIEGQLEQEKEKEKVVFYENMSSNQRIIHNFLHRPKKEYEHTELVKLFLRCNWFEKIMLIIAQLGATCLPFTMLAAFGSARMRLVSVILWVTCALCLLALGFSRRRRTGEEFKISFLPKFNSYK